MAERGVVDGENVLRRYIGLDVVPRPEAFRHAVIKLLLSKGLISEDFASTLLCWKKVRINGDDHKTRIALSQYKWSERAQPAPAI
jgi:hypothetical protein